MEKQKRWMGSLWIKRTWKNRHFEVSSALLLRNKNDSFLEWIVTCDEKFFDNRWRSAQWLNHPQHFPKFHQKKIMVIIWWFVIGLIHYSFLNPAEIITVEMYCHQIDEMYEKFQCLCLALVNRNGSILHDTRWACVPQPTLQKLNELVYLIHRIETLIYSKHLIYSLDLLPIDYHFFKHLDNF